MPSRLEFENASTLRVILIGNYEYDHQQSMQRFANLLIRELPRYGVSVELCRPIPVFGRLKPSGSGIGKWLGYVDKFFVFPFVLSRALRNARHADGPNGALVVHICDHSNAHYTRYLSDVPHLVTCHDLFAIRQAFGEFAGHRLSITGRKLQQIILGGLRRAAKIVCVSTATSADVQRLVGKGNAATEVILNGLNYPYSPMPAEEARTRLANLLRRHGASPIDSYIFHVGANLWYKNRLGVLRIYGELCAQWNVGAGTRPKLLLAGELLTEEMEALRQANPEWSADVVVLNAVDDNEDLRALYSAAELLLFPSLEEGFGWPVSEAQACGCPVVTTGKAPMTEVGGSSPTYLDTDAVNGSSPKGNAAAARSVMAVLQESEASRRERIDAGLVNAKRFSSETMVRHYIQTYRTLAAGARSVR
jgi:glycosyltransferase involved in cell wall biosynthesis